MVRTGPGRRYAPFESLVVMETVTRKNAPSKQQSHVVCGIWRRIDEKPNSARIAGHVPANSYACINLIADGSVRALSRIPMEMPAFFVTGPFTAPLATEASANLRSLSVVVQPWLLRDWFGIEPSAAVNAIIDLGASRPIHGQWVGRLAEALRFVCEHPDRSQVLWDAFADGPAAAAAGEVFSELLVETLQQRGIAQTAKLQNMSARHYGRRFIHRFGIPPARWTRLKRLESALDRVARAKDMHLGLSDLAVAAGYSDQPHMTREVGSLSGRSPALLFRNIANEAPGYWAFKSPDVRIVQDTSGNEV